MSREDGARRTSEGVGADDPWLKCAAAAAIAGMSEATIWRAVRTGRLRAVRVGGGRAIRLRRSWVEEWICFEAPTESGRVQ